VYGFAKSNRDNIREDEERYYKGVAKKIFAHSDEKLTALKKIGELIEI
jgi:hypothetical protein